MLFTDDTEEKAAVHYPSHPLSYPNDVWVDPALKRPIPKDLRANLEWRKKVIQRAEHSAEIQQALMAACSKSPHFFLNTFAWTYRPKQTCSDGFVRGAGAKWRDKNGVQHIVPHADAPVITWPAQDLGVSKTIRVFDGGNLLWDKSREQGATVLIMYMIGWGLLFRERFSALVISRKAAMVDSRAEDSLFGKVDYLLAHLPGWMVPDGSIERLHGDNPFMGNKIRGSRMLGETSNKDVGQSLRTTITFVDEAARFPDGRSMRKSIDTVSAGYIFASTPSGPGTEFTRMRRQANTRDGSKVIDVVTLGYWDHPQMGQDRKLKQDRDGNVTGTSGKYYWETAAFKIARAESTGHHEIRENWLIDHETSGLGVLDENALAKLRRHCSEPLLRGEIDPKRQSFRETKDGRLLLWCTLDDWGSPNMDTNYVIGIDVAQGVDASNTIFAVLDRSTNRIVAEYADPTIQPHHAAVAAAALGFFFGGQHGQAFIVPERDGPGIAFSHELVRSCQYPHVYYQRIEDRRNARRMKRYGWTSNGPNKEILFKELNKSIQSSFSTPSLEGVEDMGEWLYDDRGRITCGRVRDLSTGAQARHGDRAIAYALCVIGIKEVPLFEPDRPFYRTGTMGEIAGHSFAEEYSYAMKDPFS
mgnify:CR=1 FL=1